EADQHDVDDPSHAMASQQLARQLRHLWFSNLPRADRGGPPPHPVGGDSPRALPTRAGPHRRYTKSRTFRAMTPGEVERARRAARPEGGERELMRLALAAPGAAHGALFVWDRRAHALALAHHVVEGMTVTLPARLPAERAGIAGWVYEHDQPY